jgi:hypothetical protein
MKPLVMGGKTMVCRDIITCPLVRQLRGELELCRILYCETGLEACARHRLVVEGQRVPPTLLPNGSFLDFLTPEPAC